MINDSDWPPPDEDTGRRNLWRANVEARLRRLEDFLSAMKVVKWLFGTLVVLMVSLGAWSVRTTLVNEVRMDSIKLEIGYLREDLKRLDRRTH